MIEEAGRVIAVESGTVWVETWRRAGCGRCDEPGGCGNGELARRARDRAGRVRALDPRGIAPAVGDAVLVGIPEGAVLRGVLVLYLLPLALLLAGAAAGQALRADDAGALLGAGAGIILAFFVVRRLSRHAAHDPAGQPVLLRRLAGDGPADASCPRT